MYRALSTFAISAAAAIAAVMTMSPYALAQAGAGGPQAFPTIPGDQRAANAALAALGSVQKDLPANPTAVALPTMSAKITGPGAMYDSSPAQWPGFDMKHFNYEVAEYFVSGSASGKPYTTRLVIRKPANNAKFSGLVLAEAMHVIGAAHGFEFTSVYTMDSGHAAAEILTTGSRLFVDFNKERYGKLRMTPDQSNEILAQVGALVRGKNGPLAGLTVRKMVLFGTSASSFILTNYLTSHMVYRTPEMQHIYDGFLVTSNGSVIQNVDVPLIQIPTQHEYENIATARQDSDQPGEQFRDYEFAGMGHLDSRNNIRFKESDCLNPRSSFPLEAYMSVGLHHLFQWVDKGISPPHADRILIDRNTAGDGSLMALDENGNPKGGIRNPYVDLAVVKYTARNTPSKPAPAQGAGPADMLLSRLCFLSVWTTPIPQAKLKQMYGDKGKYVRKFEARLKELEKEGWSLPVYHDLIVADARKVEF
ncbi:MAG: alpha/beta hydrolase domain-containing protein [Acidobacteriota bacterium]|nr:alpha/beta hydrolase domain-containing protein [Acidobacteriota bacterium]